MPVTRRRAAGLEDVAEEQADGALTDDRHRLPRDVAELLDGVEHARQRLQHDGGGGRQAGVVAGQAVAVGDHQLGDAVEHRRPADDEVTGGVVGCRLATTSPTISCIGKPGARVAPQPSSAAGCGHSPPRKLGRSLPQMAPARVASSTCRFGSFAGSGAAISTCSNRKGPLSVCAHMEDLRPAAVGVDPDAPGRQRAVRSESCGRMDAPAPHRFVAHVIEEAANKIHDDDVAQQFGFTGALVPGVELFARLTTPLVEAWGEEWLAGGRVDVRFRRPVYDGEELLVEVADGGALTATGPDGEVRCLGSAARTAERPDLTGLVEVTPAEGWWRTRSSGRSPASTRTSPSSRTTGTSTRSATPGALPGERVGAPGHAGQGGAPVAHAERGARAVDPHGERLPLPRRRPAARGGDVARAGHSVGRRAERRGALRRAGPGRRRAGRARHHTALYRLAGGGADLRRTLSWVAVAPSPSPRSRSAATTTSPSKWAAARARHSSSCPAQHRRHVVREHERADPARAPCRRPARPSEW